MMVYNPLTPAWNIGIFSFILQMLLLILILISQLKEGDRSTFLNVPYQIDNIARIGQYAVTFLCLLSQEDVLTSFQSICALWKCDCTAFQKLFVNSHDLSASGHDLFAHYDDSPIQAAAEAKRKYCDHFFYFHILLPNLLKFFQGICVLAVSLVIIVKGDNLVDLLKDCTALFIVSTIDNVVFFYATAGFFGQKVGRQAQATTEKVIADVKKWTFKVRPIVMIIIGSIMIIALSTVTYGQVSGNYFEQKYPDCAVTDNVAAISNMKNGICDGGELNTLGCDFDGGDCIYHNLAFPGCNVKDPEVLLGNGVCDGYPYNTPECKYDGGDCLKFNSQYPNCNIPDPDQLGDGTCNTTSPYNSILCGFDGGDCEDDVNEDRCKSKSNANQNGIIELLGDGRCNAVNNNRDCGWDGKDCLEFNAKYPVCGAKYNSTVDPERVGDGTCDNFGGYNSRECGNDGSDCSSFNFQYPECEGENPDVIGDGMCDPEFNNVECGFDGYDCDVPNYPDCTVEYPGWIGNGSCDNYGAYNTAECGFDGGDCL
eukprot:scaffold4135_cov177-Chaetoceros_neogracile.AAC.2